MELVLSKYQTQFNELNNKIEHITNLINDLNSKKQTNKVKNSKKVQQKKLSELQKQINDLNINMKKEQTNEYRTNTLTKMRNDNNFGEKKATLVPKSPNTNQSYVILFIKNENTDTSPQINTKSVENGMNMATTSQRGANTITFDAVIGGDSADDIDEVNREVNKLKYWSNNGTPLIFHSNNLNSESVQISAFTASYEYIDGGTGINTANVSITLTEAEFFNTNVSTKKGSKKYVGHKGNKKGTKNKINSNTTKHRYIIAKSGDTYIKLAREKGVTLSHVRQLNKYADRSIPIGAKLYY